MYYRKTNPFYLTPGWRHRRRDVLKADRYECQYCKAKGFYKRAVSVHHVNPIEQFPELALEMYYIDADGKTKRNLMSACDKCHKEEDDNRRKKDKSLNEEKW
jgi:5-methylcytosine-specific restriction endonuclease McrA